MWKYQKLRGDCHTIEKDVHVVPDGTQWAVEVGRKSGDQTHATQEDSIKSGTERAKRDKVELIIHSRDGQIRERERNSFGMTPEM